VHAALNKAEQDRYGDLTLHSDERNHLLGYRDQGYDETPADVRVLLQITSDDQAVMEWGDVETLSFLIPKKDLARGDFSKVYPHVGD
jgi:uncharacterized protein YwqG